MVMSTWSSSVCAQTLLSAEITIRRFVTRGIWLGLTTCTVLCAHATAPAATVILPNLNLAAHQQTASMVADLLAVVHLQQLFQELKQHSRLLSRPRFLESLQQEQLALAKQVRGHWLVHQTQCQVCSCGLVCVPYHPGLAPDTAA